MEIKIQVMLTVMVMETIILEIKMANLMAKKIRETQMAMEMVILMKEI